jgi:hypothetical protein
MKKLKAIQVEEEVNTSFDAFKSLLSREQDYKRVTDTEALKELIYHYMKGKSNDNQ